MGKAVYSAGQVVSGDYQGKNVYRKSSTEYIIVSRDEGGKLIVGGLLPTSYSTLAVISKETVARYEEVSASGRRTDPNAVVEGLVWFGPVGALLGAVAGQQAGTTDVAIYFKNGEKSLLQMSTQSWQELKRALFQF